MSVATVAVMPPQFSISYSYEPVSQSSEELTRRWAEARDFLRGSASDWTPIVDAARRAIRSECSQENWDGEGALPVSDQVIAVAEKVVGALFELIPKGTPAPELVPEADGEICISWAVDAGKLFSMSVGSHGKINFAGQFGNEGGIHGWRPIDEESPSFLDESLLEIAKYVERLYKKPVKRGAA
jgi:hypothetical protein